MHLQDLRTIFLGRHSHEKDGSHPSVIISVAIDDLASSVIPMKMGISFDSDPRTKSKDDACCKIPGSNPCTISSDRSIRIS